jgi:Ran GTPase-activating protein (RanGAP) involved in mRNA processing and transport
MTQATLQYNDIIDTWTYEPICKNTYIFDDGKYLCMKECNITTNQLDNIIKKIELPQKIKYIDMSNNHIDDDAGNIIKKLFSRYYSNIEYINLSGNKLGSNFAKILVTVLLRYNNTICIDLSNNNFTLDNEKNIEKICKKNIIIFKSANIE